MTEAPPGCLSCNREEIESFLRSQNVTPDKVELVTNMDLEGAMPPCPQCGTIFRVKIVKHSIDEDWAWIARDRVDGSKELIGVQYPNGDRKMALDMPAQQWKAYLRKGQLKADKHGKLSVVREKN